MNSPRGPTIHLNADRAIGILLSATLFATIGFYASSVAAQQAVSSGTIETFPAGDSPVNLAFDGENIWVTNGNFAESTVTKLRASDGALLGTFPVAGVSAYGITFDGENIWVTSPFNFFVTKLRASDGEFLGVVAVDEHPLGLTFDGHNIWVASQRPDTPMQREAGKVTKIRPSDLGVLGVFPAGPGPSDLTFDGANIWVVNEFVESVTKIRASDGALLGTFPVQLHGGELRGIVFDGGNIWVTEFNTGPASSGSAPVTGHFWVSTRWEGGLGELPLTESTFGSPIFEAIQSSD